MLIVLSGLPGCGKSAVASSMGQRLQCPVFSVDPIESALLKAGFALSFETGLAAYLVAATLADRHLELGQTVIVDAVNAVEEAKNLWRRLSLEHRRQMKVIDCFCSDTSVHRHRLETRARGLLLPEPTWEQVHRRQAEVTPWHEPHLRLDSVSPLEENVDRALRFVHEG